jgi:threonine/homoserine/homoserine lactone efflux protein
MSSTVAELLPSAAAVALSPFPIIAVVVVLSAPDARRNGVAFAAGWLAGLTALTSVMVMVVGVTASEGEGSPALAWVRVLVGAALLVLAVRKWRSRPAPDEEPKVPRWMASLDGLSARRSVGIGLALAGANPKNIALTAAAVAAVGSPGWSDAERLLVIATYVALASITVIGAVLAHLVAGERAAAALSALKGFMLRHNTVILVAVLVLLGVMIGGEGLSSLRG